MLHSKPWWNHGIWKKNSTKETFYSALWSVFPSLQYPECSEKLFLLGSFLKTRFLKVWWVSKCKTWVGSAWIWEKLKWDWGETTLDSAFSCRRWELSVWVNWRTSCNCRFQELPQEQLWSGSKDWPPKAKSQGTEPHKVIPLPTKISKGSSLWSQLTPAGASSRAPASHLPRQVPFLSIQPAAPPIPNKYLPSPDTEE